MNRYSLTMLSTDFQKITSELLLEGGVEHAAYALCSASKVENDPWNGGVHERFLVNSIESIPESDIIESTAVNIKWKTDSFVKMLKKANKNEQVLAIIHSHPSGHDEFSNQDNENEIKLLQGAMNRNGGKEKLISIIVTQDRRIRARVWQANPEPDSMNMDKILVIGDKTEIHYPEKNEIESPEFLHRQSLAFGESLNKDIGKLNIGIVGCGGTGSAVASLLPRLGAKFFLLIDEDKVEKTNLNRLHGAKKEDIGKPKVEVIKNAIENMGLGAKVNTIKGYVGRNCLEQLKSCDVIFGCTDDHQGRSYLNSLSYWYMITYIDMGISIEIDNNKEKPEIRHLNERVTVVMPGNTCLMCTETINPQGIRDDGARRANPGMTKQQKESAYVQDERNPNPAVVTFTTEIACTAINELIHRLQGFLDKNRNNQMRMVNLGESRSQKILGEENCRICGKTENWGVGDRDKSLGLVD